MEQIIAQPSVEPISPARYNGRGPDSPLGVHLFKGKHVMDSHPLAEYETIIAKLDTGC